MKPRISEKEFKENLIKNLNQYSSGWIDGDKEKGFENKNTADVVNRRLKIYIEIKDDGCFSEPKTGHWTGEFKIKQINGQLRRWIKISSKKFINYEGYKTLVLIRTDKTDWPWVLLESAIFGVRDPEKQHGFEWPGSVFRNDNLSGKNVGGILFWGRTRAYFTKNINPNVSKTRIISYEWIKEVFQHTKEIMPLKTPSEDGAEMAVF
ncbi:MAG: hypothetical protein Q8Q46_00765 [Candidatus Giovannonibacteria bacterium]|nr:hypothetical protein [Candidatus Giovannonibacteria bacterium]